MELDGLFGTQQQEMTPTTTLHIPTAFNPKMMHVA
jgi:hypothetical protein